MKYSKSRKLRKYPYGGDPNKDAVYGTLSAGAEVGLNLVAPGLGTAYNAFNNLTNSATTNSDGLYKSKGAMVLNYALNPLEFISDATTGNLGKKKVKEYLAGEKQKAFQASIDTGRENLRGAIAGGYSQTGYDNVMVRKYGGYLRKYPKGGNIGTKLSEGQEIAYRKWMDTIGHTESKGYSVDKDYNGLDYDYRGYWKEAQMSANKDSMLNLGEGAHLPDTYKYANHETHSNESKYKQAPRNSKGYWDENDEFVEFAMGGNMRNPQYEVEGDEVVEGDDVNLENQENLSSDMTKAIGPTHEEGGVEGQGGERVYSDRLKTSEYSLALLKSMGFKPKKNSTAAEAAEFIAKKQKVYEDLLKSHSPADVNTGKQMLERIEQAKEVIFQDQENQKALDDMRTYKNKRKYRTGGPIDPNEDYPPIPSEDGKRRYNIDGQPEGGSYDDKISEGYSSDLTPEDSGNKNKEALIAAAIGTGVNTLNYYTNLSEINKLKTDFTPQFATPRYKTYADRSGAGLNEINRNLNTAVRGLRYSSSRSKNAAIANLVGQSYSASNQIVNNENIRRDTILGANVDTENQFNVNRYLTLNQANLDNMNRSNEKIATRTQARNAYLDATMRQFKEFRDTKYANDKNDADTEAAQEEIMMTIMSDNTGVAERLAEKMGIPGATKEEVAKEYAKRMTKGSGSKYSYLRR